MNFKIFTFPLFVSIAGLVISPAAYGLQTEPKRVTRVERPKFTKADWDGIYFENLFSEGLVGDRPAGLAPGAITASPAMPSNNGAPTGGTGIEATSSQWNNLISNTTLEDEVKAIQKKLAADITTPVRFKSDYAKAHRSFSVLSMIFAIISKYDGNVRWKQESGSAQVAFWRAASNSRVGTIQAYESCKARAEALAELVRGGKFTGDEKAPDDFDWANVVDRNPLMHRLQESMDRLKTLTANKGDFTRQVAEVNHESEIVAAIALVLKQENMTDADDDGYKAHSDAMQKYAEAAVQGIKGNDYDAVSKAVNGISQSCDACHGDWR